MSQAPEPLDLHGAADPAAAFWTAHREGRRIALRTSGTTTSPRTVVRTTQSWVVSFEEVSRITGTSAESTVWVPGPLTATMNLFAVVHAQASAARVVTDARDATHAVLTPLALARALGSGRLGQGLTAVVAGDVLSPKLRELCATAGIRLHNYYGASELSFVAWAAQDSALTVLPGVECRIDDGEIWVRSAYLSDGYLSDGSSVAGSPGPMRWSADGFATVGDRGQWRGEHLVVHGRGDSGITTAGVTVVVADVEAVLRDRARGSVVVVGMPDDRLGAIVCAVVTDPEDVPCLRETARSGLDATHRPRRWLVVPEIPMTPAGKPDREALVLLVTGGGVETAGSGPGGTMAT